MPDRLEALGDLFAGISNPASPSSLDPILAFLRQS
jgi:hypothetical protein